MKKKVELVEELDQVGTTDWKNELDKPQTIKLCVPNGKAYGGAKLVKLTFAPGETKTLSSEYDDAIHYVENGVIKGGLAPLLTKVGGTDVLADFLDPEKMEAQADAKAMVQAALEREILEGTLSRAAEKIAKRSKK